MFSSISLKTKLLLLSCFLLSISVAVGFTSNIFFHKVTSEYDVIADVSIPKFKLTYEMMLDYRSVRINLRSFSFTDLTPEQAKEAWGKVQAAIHDYEEKEKKYLKYLISPQQKELYEKVHITWQEYRTTGEDVFNLYKQGTPEAHEKIHDILIKDGPEKAKIYTEAMAALLEYNDKAMKASIKTAKHDSQMADYFIIAIIAIGVLFGMTMGYLVSQKVSKIIGAVASELALGSNQIQQASTQISESSQGLSQAATEQATSLEETVSTMEEITAMVKLNTENGKQAAALASSTRDVALKGEKEIKTLIDAIYSISADSQKIEQITAVIDDIAFQTNLLALNAAVEAARAGEQGRGFAVVAEAVRSLAQRSSHAAKDITDLIRNSVEKIENGSKQAAQSGQVLSEIVTSVKKVADLNFEIANASEEQSTGIMQINKALTQLDQVTQHNAASSEEAAASAEELSVQATSLVDIVHTLEDLVFGKNGETEVKKPAVESAAKARKVVSNVHQLRTKSKAETIIPFGDVDAPRKVGSIDGF
ncbi:methyl-accepting chemotaxis protein [Bdellovibrio reynosensis]|uniref:Methyl-accepting chemotaxis protein n=1 Tax=Bdellovibrio reynosensis TaxID=2835041 RepID=A0ABY4C741_9BACT|nr:methyl-accepting chemotaxis protein [Bdellovibrio reynosensis]UOF00786.1 methyl-accepting chemotaxis protein [Bdellovibrio reynosensis]